MKTNSPLRGVVRKGNTAAYLIWLQFCDPLPNNVIVVTYGPCCFLIILFCRKHLHILLFTVQATVPSPNCSCYTRLRSKCKQDFSFRVPPSYITFVASSATFWILEPPRAMALVNVNVCDNRCCNKIVYGEWR